MPLWHLYRDCSAVAVPEAEQRAAAEALALARRELRLPWITVRWFASTSIETERSWPRRGPAKLRGIAYHGSREVLIRAHQGPEAVAFAVLHECAHVHQNMHHGPCRGPVDRWTRERDADVFAARYYPEGIAE